MCVCEICKKAFEETSLLWVKIKEKYILLCEKCHEKHKSQS